MKFIILFTLIASNISLLWASGSSSHKIDPNCKKIKVEADDIELKWTGYKFPGADKKGVSGTLRNLGIQNEYKGTNLTSIFAFSKKSVV